VDHCDSSIVRQSRLQDLPLFVVGSGCLPTTQKIILSLLVWRGVACLLKHMGISGFYCQHACACGDVCMLSALAPTRCLCVYRYCAPGWRVFDNQNPAWSLVSHPYPPRVSSQNFRRMNHNRMNHGVGKIRSDFRDDPSDIGVV
jgi:hypothetical protein